MGGGSPPTSIGAGAGCCRAAAGRADDPRLLRGLQLPLLTAGSARRTRPLYRADRDDRSAGVPSAERRPTATGRAGAGRRRVDGIAGAGWADAAKNQEPRTENRDWSGWFSVLGSRFFNGSVALARSRGRGGRLPG